MYRSTVICFYENEKDQLNLSKEERKAFRQKLNDLMDFFGAEEELTLKRKENAPQNKVMVDGKMKHVL